MKKFIKSLVLTLIILPCIVFMSACGGNSPPEEPEYELTVQSIYALVQAKGYEGTFDEFLSAIKGEDGTDGKDGRSITNIELTSSNDGIDTYTITYSDNTTSTYTITNGKDGQAGTPGADGRGIVLISCLNSFIETPGMQHPDYYTYRILYTDSSYFDFKVYNGKNGTNGTSITSITQTNNDANNSSTITITDSNGDKKEFTLYNGVDGKDGTGIDTITKTSTDGLVDTYTITFTDSKEPFTYTVTNGKDGTDGIGIEDLTINTDGELEITLTNNDAPINLGKIKGEDGKDGSTITEITKTNTSGLIDTYTISCSDGKEFTFTVTNGKDGEDGRGIKSIKQTETTEADGRTKTTIIFEYTDGTESDPIYIYSGKNGANGSVGKDGVGITDISLVESQDGTSTTITITYGNNDLTETFTIYNGNDGEDGRGISSIGKTSTRGLVDTYTITYTDNTTSTFDVTNGVSVTDAEINTNNELVISLSDGKTINVGNVKGDTGNGIESIEKTKTEGLEDTYTITYTNGDTTTFTVVNGRGIKEIKKESNGLIDTYTITYTDNSEPYIFTITNGQNGLSAYEIYKIHNPLYTKSEAEWIIDLTNGDLSTNRLTVAFDSNGGTEVESQTDIKFGGKATKPIEPTKDGYSFDGWYYKNEKWSFVGYSVTEDMTLTASWTPISYTISFNTNGYGEYDSIELTFEDDLVLPTPEIAGYTYDWKVNGEIITNGKWNIASDTTIELVLTPIEYTITYILDDGTNNPLNPSIYTIESNTITLSEASKDNYYFVGWYETSAFAGNKITSIESGSTGNKTLYALFTLNKFDLVVDTDGGDVANYTLSIYGGEEYSLPTPNKEHFVFNSWIGYTNEEKTEYVELDQSGNWNYTSVVYIKATYNCMYDYNGSYLNGLTEYWNGTELIIPTQIDGTTITTIKPNAFSGNTTITSIVIPNTITRIGKSAFSGCSNVRTLTIGENVSVIENYAFSGLVNIITLNYNAIDVSDFQEQYSEWNDWLNRNEYVLNATFFNLGRANGTTVNIGEKVVKIPAYMFYAPDGTPNIKEICYATNGKIEEIGAGAFAGTNLKSITIPQTIKYLGYRAFCDMLYLEEVIFNAKELTYKSGTTNGNGNLNQLFVGIGRNSSGTKIIIGKDVENLNYKIFDCSGYAYANKITTIDFSNNSNITVIPDNFFERTYYITTLILPQTITEIGVNAFYSGSETYHLNIIYYMGNQTEFDNITVDNTNDGNKYFNSAEVYYYSKLYGDVSSGFDNYWYFEDGEIKTWTAEKYTITYNLFDGTNNENNPSQFTKYESDIVLQSPTRENYVFAGWYIDSNFTHQITTITEDKDYTLYARWSSASFVVTLNTDGGNVSQTEITIYNDYNFTLPIPTKDTLAFVGWFDESDNQITNSKGQSLEVASFESNTTLTAHWTDAYVLSFVTNSNTSIENQYYGKGQTITLPENPTRYNYSFAGWYTDSALTQKFTSSVMPAKNLILYAKWQAYTLTISFPEKLGISVNDTINATLFNAVATDIDGNTFDVTAKIVKGTLIAGTSVDILFTATGLYNKSASASILNLPVYGLSTITGYNLDKNYINASDTLNAKLFKVKATDTYGNTPTIDVFIVEENATTGTYVTIRIQATDKANNVTYIDIENVAYYGAPIFTYTEILNAKVTDGLTTDFFNATAVDSFGMPLEVITTVENTVDSLNGKISTVKLTATDSKGNIKTITFDVKLYNAPTLTIADTYLKIDEEINVNSLQITSLDSFLEEVNNITITYISGMDSAGNVMKYQITATDIVGNVTTEVINIKLYGTPTLMLTTKHIKHTDTISTDLFGAEIRDSFGGILETTVEMVAGEMVGGTTISVKFTATDNAGNTLEQIIDDICVYNISDLTISYDSTASSVIKYTSNGEEFEPITTDSFGNQTNTVIRVVSGSLSGGKTVSIKVGAKDKAGNVVYGDLIKNVKVYDEPIITWEKDYLYLYENEQFEYFVYAKDSFGLNLQTSIEIIDGEFSAGNQVTIRVTATDIAGNTIFKEFTLDVLSLNQAYVVLIKDYNLDYNIIELNCDYVLSEGVWKDLNNIQYTDSDGRSLLQFTTIGTKVLCQTEPTNVILINNIQDLLLLKNTENLDKEIYLNNDINLNGVEWTPIGTESNPFTGMFNGNGYTISNFKITTGREYNGFFGYTKNSTIKNLGLENFIINYSRSYDTYAGGLVGYAKDSTITNCYTTGDVSATLSSTSSSAYAGGLVGYASSSTIISNCYATGDVSATSSSTSTSTSTSSFASAYAGGLVGYASSSTIISNCYATGDVSATSTSTSSSSSASAYAGGLVGDAYSSTISNCYATGDVSATSSSTSTSSSASAGGLVGYAGYSTITNCYATGDVSATSSSGGASAGGLVGCAGYSIISNCYATGDVSATSTSTSTSSSASAGGLVGGAYSSTISNCYATGDVSATSSSTSTSSSASAGGLVGYAYSSSTISNCYATGDVSATSSSGGASAGGLVGYAKDSTITNCYRYFGQTITAKKVSSNGSISTNGTSADMKTIWSWACETWEDARWNFYSNQNPTLPYYDGTPIEISSATELLNLSNKYLTANYVLTNNIDLGGIEWTPVNIIGGTVDGNGFVISNFKITTGRQYNGFFGYTKNSTIKNLGLENFIINYSYSSKIYVGGLVGYAKDLTIINCYATGDVSAKATSYSSGAYVGGLVGYAEDSTIITNCYATGDVSATSSSGGASAGGLVGYAKNSTITNCYATGDVSATATSSSDANAGGLVGGAYSSTISNCYRYSVQTVTAKKGSSNGYISTNGTSASMEEIWAFAKENWDADVWNLYDDKNPTLKQTQA